MRKSRIMQIIENYTGELPPSRDINIAEAMNIIEASQSEMDMVENAYLYGHMRATYDNGHTRPVPLYNIRQLTDEEWMRLAAKNKETRS